MCLGRVVGIIEKVCVVPSSLDVKMADDTREQQSSVEDGLQEQEIRRPRRKPKPKHEFPQTQAGKMWDAFGNPDEPINTMPGGKFNSAGGRPPEVTWRDAFIFTRKDADNLFSGNFAKFPCARDSLLVGMGGGAAFGGLNFIVSGVFFRFHCSSIIAHVLFQAFVLLTKLQTLQ